MITTAGVLISHALWKRILRDFEALEKTAYWLNLGRMGGRDDQQTLRRAKRTLADAQASNLPPSISQAAQIAARAPLRPPRCHPR